MNRELPQWSKSLKKWMGDNGAMTNLQKEFIFHLEDSLIQPLKAAAVKAKREKEVAEKTIQEHLDTIKYLTQRNAQLQVKKAEQAV
jgi:hypothetical protein